MKSPLFERATARKVLVAVEPGALREQLTARLAALGCEVLGVADGDAALEAFVRERPECALLAARLPGRDGFETCSEIKRLAAEDFTPVLLLAADVSPDVLRRGSHAGADECLATPIAPGALESTLRAYEQVRALRGQLREQHEELLQRRTGAQEEEQLAKSLMHRILHRGDDSSRNLRRLEAPAESFAGDIVLCAWSPGGRQHVLVGDFTGHGLQAALGALPAADIFYSMTRAGFGVPEIVRELNKRLHRLFPPNIFLCACALEIDHSSGMLAAWNGGLPAPLLRDPAGRLREIESRRLPLGVLAPQDFDEAPQMLRVEDGERVFVYTDGVVELENARGEMFDSGRLRAILGGKGDAELIFERLELALRAHGKDHTQRDDLALLEVLVGADLAPQRVAAPRGDGALREPLEWSLEVRLDGRALGVVDPKPLLMRALHDLQGLDPHQEALHTVLSELYNNAVDHGVLALDSALKQDAESFAEYYALRERKLAELESGSVLVRLEHRSLPGGGALTITVRDDGAGFDPLRLAPALSGRPSGRGLALVRSFCSEFEHFDGGRACRAVYEWRSASASSDAA
jgi:serine phosphatase RsbU (regulator of sigma subunit)/anti-sigma regulatory factor (Ser/Thr protein kinase)